MFSQIENRLAVFLIQSEKDMYQEKSRNNVLLIGVVHYA
jgi:hypothetical protein